VLSKEFPVKTLWLTSIIRFGLYASLLLLFSLSVDPTRAQELEFRLSEQNRQPPEAPDWPAMHFEQEYKLLSFQYEFYGKLVRVAGNGLIADDEGIVEFPIAIQDQVRDAAKLRFIGVQCRNSILPVPRPDGILPEVRPRGKLLLKTNKGEYPIYLGDTSFSYQVPSGSHNHRFYSPGLARLLQRELNEKHKIELDQDWVAALSGKTWLEKIRQEAQWPPPAKDN
jgi:hypothetical protein